MTCHDNCVHYSVCYKRPDHFDDLDVNGGCKDFANSALFIDLPCKVGDTVYNVDVYDYCTNSRCNCCANEEELTDKKCQCHVKQIKIIEQPFKIEMLSDIGNTVFITIDEARKKVKALKSCNGEIK